MASYTNQQFCDAIRAALDENMDVLCKSFLSRLSTVDCNGSGSNSEAKPTSKASESAPGSSKPTSKAPSSSKSSSSKGKAKTSSKPAKDGVLAKISKCLASPAASKCETQPYYNLSTARPITMSKANLRKGYLFYQADSYFFAGAEDSEQLESVLEECKAAGVKAKRTDKVKPSAPTTSSSTTDNAKSEAVVDTTASSSAPSKESELLSMAVPSDEAEFEAWTNSGIDVKSGPQIKGIIHFLQESLQVPEDERSSPKGNKKEMLAEAHRLYDLYQQRKQRQQEEEFADSIEAELEEATGGDEEAEETSGNVKDKAKREVEQIMAEAKGEGEKAEKEEQEDDELSDDDEGEGEEAQPELEPAATATPADEDLKRVYTKIGAYKRQHQREPIAVECLDQWVRRTGEDQALVKYILLRWQQMERKFGPALALQVFKDSMVKRGAKGV